MRKLFFVFTLLFCCWGFFLFYSVKPNYSELILGNWMATDGEMTINNESFEIDPIFGTLSTINSGETNVVESCQPCSLGNAYLYSYTTFKYDGIMSLSQYFYDSFNTLLQTTNPDFNYTINENIISQSSLEDPTIIYEYYTIMDVTNSNLQLTNNSITSSDTIDNVFTLTNTTQLFNYIKVSEIPSHNEN